MRDRANRNRIIDGLEIVGGTWGSNVYLADGVSGLGLIDAGFPMDYRKIVRHLSGRGSSVQELELMVATHYHLDHVGNMQRLKEVSGARVAAHEEDAPYMEGSRPYETFKVDFLRTVYYRSLRPLFTYRYVGVDILLEDGSVLDLLGGLEVIHVPGHTVGSIMLFGKDQGLLFSGDTIRNEKGKIEGPPPQFTPRPDLSRRALEERVLHLDFDVLLPGHGEPVFSGAGDRVRAALDRSRTG